jgi:signal transduction histidine kinase/HAMP domain-containing protein
MFSLRMKLLAGLGALLGILITVTLLGNSVLARYSNSIQQLFAEDYDSVAASQAMKEALERMLEKGQGQAWNGEPASASVRDDEDVATFERQLALQRTIADVPGEREATDQLGDTWNRFRSTYDLLDDGHLTLERRQQIFVQQILPLAREVRRSATKIIDMNLRTLETGRGSARQKAYHARLTMHLLAAVGIAMAVGIVLVAGVIVLRPLRVLEASLKQISRGNLEMKVQANRRDEIGQLGRAFNDMAAQLREFKRIDHERLVRTQHTTQLAIDSLPDAVVVIDPRGIIELTNETAARLFHLSPGMNVINDLPTPWLSDLHQQAMSSATPQNGGNGYSAAMRRVDGGEERFFLPRTYGIVDEKQTASVIGSAVVLADVTELKRLDQLKTDLLATTAHELKTPLTSMRLIMHLMAEERIGPLNARQRDVITAAREDSDRLHHVVETLLDMDRLRSGKVMMESRSMRVDEIIRECVDPHRDAIAAAGLELRVEIPSGQEPETLRVDQQRLSYVFGNLINNAIKYTPGGGWICVSVEPTANGVHFCVADNGQGIADSFRHRVFERFFRVPGQSGESGSGLGLAIVKSVIEAHRGRVWIESQVGEGTKVHFVIPPIAVETAKETSHGDSSRDQTTTAVA